MQAYGWLLAGLALLLSELMLPGLLLFFFGIGALVTGLVCTLAPELDLSWQILLFLAVSVGSLVALRRWLKRIFSGVSRCGDGSPDEDFIGRTAVVIEPIRSDAPGRVELNGTGWRAEAADTLPTGTRVRVLARTGLSLSVEPLSQPAVAASAPEGNGVDH